ncbi:MAG: anhydro-N-acetylmuramic acid kinase [Gammaproteobacteria bacterium]|nr:anhydro-N-acetylmuramic acid kinase [Gammaproteobacteria bacterium]
MTFYLGLMSGTSMDGIDVALLDVATQHLIAGKTYPYTSVVKDKLQHLMTQSRVSLEELSHCHHWVGEAFAHAVNQFIAEFKVNKGDIVAIGSHGQTIQHAPHAEPAYTIQLGCAHTIAALTALPVVADFRTRDMVLGGQGAPLAPLYHQVLFESLDKPLAILNIGGIANVTYLLANKEVKGHDVGPGNVLLDAWIATHRDQSYDQDGAWAASGEVIPALLTDCLSDPFFALKPPKSLDKGYFSLSWLQKKLNPIYLPQDVQATLTALTAHVVAASIQQTDTITQLLVCGGGVHNQVLMTKLAKLLPSIRVISTAQLDIHPDYIEAMMIAWLASQTIVGIAIDLAPVTGGKKTILGCIYPV